MSGTERQLVDKPKVELMWSVLDLGESLSKYLAV